MPVYFFFHVSSVTAAIIGQQEASVTQPVYVYFYAGAIHHDDIGSWRLASHLGAADMNIVDYKKKRNRIHQTKTE